MNTAVRSGFYMAVAFMSFCATARGQDGARKTVPVIRGANYAIVSDEEFDAYVLIDGDSMFDDEGRLIHNGLDWMGLRKRLRKLRKSDSSKLMFHLYYSRGGDATKLLNWTVEGFGRREAHFKTVNWTNSFSGPVDFWQTINDAVRTAEERGLGDETPIGNQYVQVIPVRKFLTCLRTGNANCIVKVLPQLVDKEARLPAVIRGSILKYIAQLDPEKKDKLLFEINFHTDAKPAVEWLQKEGLKEIADVLGYKESGGTYAEYDFMLKKK